MILMGLVLLNATSICVSFSEIRLMINVRKSAGISVCCRHLIRCLCPIESNALFTSKNAMQQDSFLDLAVCKHPLIKEVSAWCRDKTTLMKGEGEVTAELHI